MELAAFLFHSTTLNAGQTGREKKKSEKGESCAILFSLPLVSACSFPQVFCPSTNVSKTLRGSASKIKTAMASVSTYQLLISLLSLLIIQTSLPCFLLHSLGQEQTGQ